MIDWSQVTVLIVEDSPTQMLVLSKSLKEKGVIVEVATNGEEALGILEKNVPNIVISDITMPKMNGYELCKNIRVNEKTLNLPVILYTALYDPEEVLHAIDCGANYFLTKPTKPELILGFIADSLQTEHQNTKIHDIEFSYSGKKHRLTADLNKVMTLLFSTYGNAMEKNKALDLAQRDLRDNNISLKILNDQKNAFLGMAAHDIRNPLSVILAYSELMQDELKDKIDEEHIKMIDAIYRSSDKILQMVNEFLDISVIESGNLNLEFSEVDLKQVFEKNIELNKNLATKKEMNISLQVEGDIPKVSCDSKKIDEVLTNYLTNAIKYSRENAQITIRLYLEDNQVVFSVTDQGQGIKEKESGKIFKTFSKTTNKTTGGESSTGLGLSIVKRIIEAQNGTVGFTSKENEGSTFFAKLPLKQPEAS